MGIKTHILGLPIIGKKRILKFVIERFIRDYKGENKLRVKRVINRIIIGNIREQINKEMDIITIGYHWIFDPMVYLMLNLGIKNKRLDNRKGKLDVKDILDVTRGIDKENGFKMRKWFGTNFHYFVNEINNDGFKKDRKSSLLGRELIIGKRIKEIKIVMIGPITFLRLSEIGSNWIRIVMEIRNRFKMLIKDIGKIGNVKWIQFDERGMEEEEIGLFRIMYRLLSKESNRKGIKIMIVLEGKKDLIRKIIKEEVINGIHIEIDKKKIIDKEIEMGRKKIVWSFGVVKGDDIWISNYQKILKEIKGIKLNDFWISGNCSLSHLPISLEEESFKKKIWNSFAYERMEELNRVKRMMNKEKGLIGELIKNFGRVKEMEREKLRVFRYIKVIKKLINERIIKKEWIKWKEIGNEILPITTIGSFPQSKEIRINRRLLKEGVLNEREYKGRVNDRVRVIVEMQRKYGVDVLVNGEVERGDMVEYFCEGLNGCDVTRNGWIQSYGTRYVKPAILWGMIKSKEDKVSYWIKELRRIGNGLIKGIITGPITMVKWALRRNDIGFKYIAIMMAMFIRKEIERMINLGVKVIQVDEPAFREVMELGVDNKRMVFSYLTKLFKFCCKKAYRERVQVHSHICYSGVNKEDLVVFNKLGIDVISIEASKELDKLINCINECKKWDRLEYGLGIYDVHGKEVTTKEVLRKRIENMVNILGRDRIWINPDCGLKTRNDIEVELFLRRIWDIVTKIREREISI